MAHKKTTITSLKASSLVEVLIAMVIIVFSISLVMIMGLKITQSSKSSSQLKAELLAHNYLQETIHKQAYFDSSTEEEHFTVNRTIEQQNDLIVVTINVATPSQSSLAKISQIIPFNE